MEYQCAITLDSPLGMILIQGSKSHIQYLKFANVKLGSIGSYQYLAATIGNAKAVRAVASANALRGYAGGIERKAKLLQLEGNRLNCTSTTEINEKTKVLNQEL